LSFPVLAGRPCRPVAGRLNVNNITNVSRHKHEVQTAGPSSIVVCD
jgi:hypothetical protein